VITPMIPSGKVDRWLDTRMARLRVWSLLAFIIGLMALTPLATAQEYASETGELDIDLTVVVTVNISGDGFVGESVVYITLVSDGEEDEIDLGTLATDDQGRFFGEITLPDGLGASSYTIIATGVTAQGATRVLTTVINVGPEPTLTTIPPTSSTTSTISEATTTSRAERGDGLDPIEAQLGPGGSDDPDDPFDRILLVRALTVGLVALGGVWWWLYRMAQR